MLSEWLSKEEVICGFEDVLSCNFPNTQAMEMRSCLVSAQPGQSSYLPHCQPRVMVAFVSGARWWRIIHTQDHKVTCMQNSWVFVSRVRRRGVQTAKGWWLATIRTKESLRLSLYHLEETWK
jgi:hypothetical protein